MLEVSLPLSFMSQQYRCLLSVLTGWIPLMLPFGLADTLTSTLDYVSFIRTAVITGREMFRNLAILKI